MFLREFLWTDERFYGRVFRGTHVYILRLCSLTALYELCKLANIFNLLASDYLIIDMMDSMLL